MISNSDTSKSEETMDIEWLEHGKETKTLSHQIFVNSSYHKSFWEAAEHAIVILDKDLNILDANPAFQDLIGTTPAEVRSMQLKDFLPQFRSQSDYTNIYGIIMGRDYSFYKDTLIKPSDSSKPMAVRIVATRVPSEKHEDFQHIIMHIYELDWKEWACSKETTDPYSNMSWSTFLKNQLAKHWVATTSFVFGVMTLIALQGELGNVIHRIFTSLF